MYLFRALARLPTICTCKTGHTVMIEKQSEALSILQVLLGATKGVAGHDMLEDVLPKPIDSPEELEKMSACLSDEDVRKKEGT